MLCAARAQAAGPVITWASDPVRPDETAMLLGEGFGPASVVELTRLQETPPANAGDSWEPVKPIQASETSLKFVIPKGWPLGAYACRVRQGEGLSAATVINAPDPWWWQGDGGETASPGGWLRVFGKSLNFGGESRIALRGAGGRLFVLKPAADGYALKCTLPPGLGPGDYQLSIHNGLGGEATWRPAGTVQVRPRTAWKKDVFNVKDFGPNPGQALLAALKKAEANGGGTVYLPRGRYPVKEALTIPQGTVLKGEAMSLVSLFWPDYDTPPLELITGTNFGIESLTLYCQNHKNVIADTAESQHMFVRQVRIRADCYFMIEKVGMDFRKRHGPASHTQCGAAVLLRGHNYEVTDCDIYASNYAVRNMRAKVGVIARNRLAYGGRGYSIENVDRLIFEENTVEGNNLLSIGNDITNFWTNYCRNIYYARNKVRQMYGADREMVTLDGAGGAYLGKVAAVDGSRMTLAADPAIIDFSPKPRTDYEGGAVTILSGTGAGQYRLVTRNQGREWEVDRPWVIPPDATSLISIAPFRGRHLFIDNTFEDGGAVQLYGAAYETVIAGNTGARMDGFFIEGLSPHAWGVQPSFFCQVLDNKILEGNGYGPRSANFEAGGGNHKPGYDGPMVRGAIFRRNECLNNAAIRLEGATQDVIVEHCSVSDNRDGIDVSASVSGVVLRANRFKNLERELTGEGLAKAVVIAPDEKK